LLHLCITSPTYPATSDKTLSDDFQQTVFRG